MKIKELLATPDKWTQGYAARNKNDKPIDPFNKEATKYCILGAAIACYGLFTDNYFNITFQIESSTSMNKEAIGAWNDAPERTHQEVLDLVTKLDI